MAATIFSLTSCHNGTQKPTPATIQSDYVHFREEIQRQYEFLRNECANVPDPPSCRQQAYNWFLQRLSDLDDAHQAALDGNYEDAYQRRKDLEKSLRQLIPTFPDIQKILGIVGDMSINVNGTTNDPPLFTTQPVLVLGPSQTVQTNQYDFTGSVEISSAELNETASLSGSLMISRQIDNQGQTTYHIPSGTLLVTEPFGYFVTVTVIDDPDNVIDLDSTGNGFVTMLTTRDNPNAAWGASEDYYNRLRLPVTLHTDGSIEINTGGLVPIDSYVPYLSWPASDYDGNGILDFNADLAAFMADYNAQDYSADLNLDGVWDQADIDFWTTHFNEDLAHQN